MNSVGLTLLVPTLTALMKSPYFPVLMKSDVSAAHCAGILCMDSRIVHDGFLINAENIECTIDLVRFMHEKDVLGGPELAEVVRAIYN